MNRLSCFLFLACVSLIRADGDTCKTFSLPLDKDTFDEYVAEIGEGSEEDRAVTASFCSGPDPTIKSLETLSKMVAALRKGKRGRLDEMAAMSEAVLNIKKEVVELRLARERNTICEEEKPACSADFHQINALEPLPGGAESCIDQKSVCVPLLQCRSAIREVSGKRGCLDGFKDRVCENDGHGNIKVCCHGAEPAE